MKPTHEEIAQRARMIYEQSGRQAGRDVQNWLEAEAQLLAARSRAQPEPRPTVKTPLRPVQNQQPQTTRSC